MPGAALSSFDDGYVVADLVAEDVGDAGSAGVRPEQRQLFLDEGANPDVLQSDGIDHAAGGLDQARSLVAGHRLQRQALGDKTADAVDGDNVFKFNPIAEGSAGGNDRVAQQHTGEANAHIRLHGLVGLPLGAESSVVPRRWRPARGVGRGGRARIAWVSTLPTDAEG